MDTNANARPKKDNILYHVYIHTHTKAHLDSDDLIDCRFGSLSVTLHLLKTVFYVFILSYFWL